VPSASEDLRQLMTSWFGCIGDFGPYLFLKSRGWTEKAGTFSKPTPSYNPSVYEAACLYFLIDEWDFWCSDPLHWSLGEEIRKVRKTCADEAKDGGAEEVSVLQFKPRLDSEAG